MYGNMRRPRDLFLVVEERAEYLPLGGPEVLVERRAEYAQALGHLLRPALAGPLEVAAEAGGPEGAPLLLEPVSLWTRSVPSRK